MGQSVPPKSNNQWPHPRRCGHFAYPESLECYSMLTLTSSTKNSVERILPQFARKTKSTVLPAWLLSSKLDW
jgi:hypothetical protein